MKCRSLIQVLSIYGTAVILAACGLSPQSNMDRDSEDMAIRGGSNVLVPAAGNNPDNPAEYVVMISTKSTSCTGSLIGRRIVLTAAHCLPVESPSEIAISYGLNGDEKFMGVEDFKVHPGYEHGSPSGASNPNDIALIELAEDAPKEFRLLEITTNLIMPREMQVTLVGYGKTHGKYNDEDAGAGILRSLDLKFSIENQNQPFLQFDQIQKGICNGDSGGPAIFRYIGRYYVIGVASHNETDLPENMKKRLTETRFDFEKVLPEFPNVDLCQGRGAYVNVKAYFKWITDTVDALIKAPPAESL